MRLLLLGALLCAFPAFAEAPPGTDLNGPEHKWWECQQQPAPSHASCCSLADGHNVEPKDWRASADNSHFQVRIEGVWYDIPNDKLISGSVLCGVEPREETRDMPKVWYVRYNDMSGESRFEFLCAMPGTLY